MKTIFVKFNGEGPSYCFKTKDETIKFGDILRSPAYQYPMFVTGVSDKEYKYVNTLTGDLTDELNSTHCELIKTLVIKPEDDVIYAHKVDNNVALVAECLRAYRKQQRLYRN